ncbi:MAG: hypothetical protein RL757_1407, partial [Bacteroidota bacterium]
MTPNFPSVMRTVSRPVKVQKKVPSNNF